MFYIVMVTIAALGLFFFVQPFWRMWTGFPNGATRVVGPGNPQVTIDQPGAYAIALEERSTFDGRVFNPGPVAIDVEVLTPAGTQIPLASPSGSYSYDTGGSKGQVIATFAAQEPAQHTIVSRHADGAVTPEFVLVVGKNPTRGLMLQTLGGCLGGFMLFAAIVAIMVAFIVR